MVGIRRNLVNENKYDIKCPYEMTPEFIVVHNTANDASAQNEVHYMINNNQKVSYHYAVDDKEIVQGIPVNRMAWHAGDGRNGQGNRKGLSIEICYSKSGGDKFIQAEKNAAEFIASLLKSRGWGIDKVKKHQDFAKKYCPHRTLDMGWDRFLNMVRSYLGENVPQATNQGTTTTSTNTGYTVTITTEVLNVRDGAGTNYKINTTVKKGEVYTIVEENNGWGKLKSGAGWISLAYTSKGYTTTKTTTSSKYVLGLYVVNASALNVRSGAGTNYKIKKTYSKGTRFDTYEIKNNWARTPSGWVCLDYCSLVRKY